MKMTNATLCTNSCTNSIEEYQTCNQISSLTKSVELNVNGDYFPVTNNTGIAVHGYAYSGIIVNQDGLSWTVSKPVIPSPKLIQQRGRATIVTWNDGTTTRVVNEEEDGGSLFHAFCAALAKKLYGSTTKLLDTINEANEKVIKCRERAAEEERAEMALAAKRKAEKEAFEREVSKRMYDLKIQREVERRLSNSTKKKKERE